jgi:TRAP-type C4-dicarboxylate transport system permease large subunit
MVGMLTPPTASVLFVASKIGGISFESGVKAGDAYLAALIAVIVLIKRFPGPDPCGSELLHGGYTW